MRARPQPPTDIETLMDRAQALGGLSLGELADLLESPLPENFKFAKGWFGLMVEHFLGSDAQNLSEPDFRHLKIELKTMPLDHHHQPKESTYVATAPFACALGAQKWRDSPVYHKLRHILWVPVEAAPTQPLSERRIGSPWLWQMDSLWEARLEQDWEELMELLHLGHVSELTARFGTYLQIRPKALNSRVRSLSSTLEGGAVWVNPKGFYLRTGFTRAILQEHFG